MGAGSSSRSHRLKENSLSELHPATSGVFYWHGALGQRHPCHPHRSVGASPTNKKATPLPRRDSYLSVLSRARLCFSSQAMDSSVMPRLFRWIHERLSAFTQFAMDSFGAGRAPTESRQGAGIDPSAGQHRTRRTMAATCRKQVLGRLQQRQRTNGVSSNLSDEQTPAEIHGKINRRVRTNGQF